MKRLLFVQLLLLIFILSAKAFCFDCNFERKIQNRHGISMSNDFYDLCFEKFKNSNLNNGLNASLEEMTLVVDAKMERILENDEGELKIKYNVKINDDDLKGFIEKIRTYDLIAYEYNMLLIENNLCRYLEGVKFDEFTNYPIKFQCNGDAELLKRALLLIIQEENVQARALLVDLAGSNIFISPVKKYSAYLEMRNQNYDEAIKQFKNIDDFDNDKMALFHLAMALVLKGNVADSEVYLRKLLMKWPDYSKGHFLLGITYKKQGIIEPAIASLTQALKCNPYEIDRCSILFERSKTYYYDKNFKMSLLDINTVIDECPSNQKYHYLRSLVKQQFLDSLETRQ